MRGRRQQEERPPRTRAPENAAHAKALQRKKAPADATRAPATRSATRPQPQRWIDADADPDGVEGPRRRHEADAVEQAARPRRQLRAVGVAVEDREEADDHRRGPQRRPPLGEDGEAEQDAGERDADLDPRQGHAHQPQHPAEGHDHRERDRQQPHRRRAELRSPEADRHHRQHVVEPGDRVVQAREEALRAALLDVGPGERRPQRRERGSAPPTGRVRSPRIGSSPSDSDQAHFIAPPRAA